jgi:hypothetical protein
MNAPMPTESMCARHPTVRSVTTCKRCGRFACAQCLPNLDELCTDCVARVSADLPPLENRALLAALGVGATSAFHGLMALLGGAMVATNDTSEDSALAMANGLASLGYLVTFITSVVLVCMWFHRAVRHALARGASLEVATPAAGVGSWFIPFVNLARPFNVTRQMLSHAGQNSGIASTWQAFWVAGNIIANVSVRLDGLAGQGVGVVSDLFLIGAGVCFIHITRSLRWSKS